MKKSRMGWWKGKLQRGRGALKQMHCAAKNRRQKKAKKMGIGNPEAVNEEHHSDRW